MTLGRALCVASFVALVASCSDEPGQPTSPNGAPWSSSLAPLDDGGGNSRIYPCERCYAIDGDPKKTSFEDLYKDIFSHDGQAKCQTKGCHGDDKGSGGLAMGYSEFESCPNEVCIKPTAEAGVWCGLTTHVYKGRRVVLHHPDGSDSTPGSSLLDAVDPALGGIEPQSLCSSLEQNCPLSKGQLARVKAWLARGAPFDGLDPGVGTPNCHEESPGLLCTDPNAQVPTPKEPPQCGLASDGDNQTYCVASTSGGTVCCDIHGGGKTCPVGQACGDPTSSDPGHCIAQ